MEVKIEKSLEKFRLDVEFVSESRRIGILGASGSGKSLLLRSLAGVESVDKGKIVFEGRTLLDTGRKICEKPQNRRVGYLFQKYALFPTMTVEENIMAGLSGNRSKKRERAAEFIEKFHLKGLEKRLPGELSGGQQQRTALARMMICRPQMILLDEPYSALDVYLRDQLQREMLEFLKEYPGTVLLVSHNRDEIYRMSEEMLVMDRGRIVGQGKTKALFQNPQTKIAARLTGCKNIADIVQKEGSTAFVPDWGMNLRLKTHSLEGVKAVAIRAHEFLMKEEENCLCFPVYCPVVTEDMFEYNLSFLPNQEAKQRMDWKVSRYLWESAGRIPEKLYLKEEKLLLLYE